MNAKLTENDSIPVLEEWISLTEAAEILGLSRQYVNKRATNGDYATLHRLGNSPALVVQREEIENIARRRTEKIVREELTPVS